jgi:hypothetical protein
MRAIWRFACELLGVFWSGVIGLFAMLVLAAGTVLVWLIGCASALLLIIALAESGGGGGPPTHPTPPPGQPVKSNKDAPERG